MVFSTHAMEEVEDEVLIARPGASSAAIHGTCTVDVLCDMKTPGFLVKAKISYHYLCTHYQPILLLAIWLALLFWTYTSMHPWQVLLLLPLWILGFRIMTYAMVRSNPILLVDFSCCKPPDQLKAPFHGFIMHLALSGTFEEASQKFQKRILERSGLGDHTYLPAALHLLPPQPTMEAAIKESQMVIFGALDDLFAKTHIQPCEIDILVANCSLFTPCPSFCSMIINRYKMQARIQSFSLSGMGCSAGVIAIDLAKDLLLRRQAYALVISTENITQNLYTGKWKSMMLPNCLFRIGGSVVLLSSKESDKKRSKYQLLHVVRTHLGSNDAAYKCVYQQQDDEGKVGVNISRDLMIIAADALKANLRSLGPLVLPISEQWKFLVNVLFQKMQGHKIKPYTPNFDRAFDHFCIHAGGKTVIEELEKHLNLSKDHVEASRMTLHRFGNTSSSTVWYELAYTEAKGRVRKGHKAWQIAFGSGFKCNSAVWKALKDIDPMQRSTSPWDDCVHEYPMSIPSCRPVPSYLVLCEGICRDYDPCREEDA